jgi:hypothetical protein
VVETNRSYIVPTDCYFGAGSTGAGSTGAGFAVVTGVISAGGVIGADDSGSFDTGSFDSGTIFGRSVAPWFIALGVDWKRSLNCMSGEFGKGNMEGGKFCSMGAEGRFCLNQL